MMWRAIAGLNGFIAIVMGAVAAHAVKDTHLASLATQASLYQLMHAVLLAGLADKSGKSLRVARILFLIGMVLFCGSLYLKALLGTTSMFAPAGGISLMLGWLALMIAGFVN